MIKINIMLGKIQITYFVPLSDWCSAFFWSWFCCFFRIQPKCAGGWPTVALPLIHILLCRRAVRVPIIRLWLRLGLAAFSKTFGHVSQDFSSISSPNHLNALQTNPLQLAYTEPRDIVTRTWFFSWSMPVTRTGTVIPRLAVLLTDSCRLVHDRSVSLERWVGKA